MTWELNFIRWLQSGGNGFWDAIFSGISFLAEDIVFVALIGFIYWCFNKKFAHYLGFAFFTSITFNAFLKNIFRRTRPFAADPEGIIVNKKPSTAEGHSFPSGHSQSSATAYGALLMRRNKSPNPYRIIFLVLGLAVPPLIAFSRLYLGVHYPTDVIAGLLLGYGVAALTYYLFEKFESRKYIMFGIVLVAMFPGFFFSTTEDFFLTYGMMAAFVLGIFLEEKFIKFEYNRVWWKMVLRLLIGAAVILLFKEGLKPIFKAICGGEEHLALRTIRYSLMVLAGITIPPVLFKALKI